MNKHLTRREAEEIAWQAWSMVRNGPGTINRILAVVAAHHKVPVAHVLSQRRSAHLVRPRFIVAWLARELTPHSLPEIGRALGDRDHTTIMHACARVQAMMDRDPAYREEVLSLQAALAAVTEGAMPGEAG